MKKKTIPNRSPVQKKKLTPEISSSYNSFYVVGIGASAGGLEALEKFFQKYCPRTRGWHYRSFALDPNHVSIMPGLIQKSYEDEVIPG